MSELTQPRWAVVGHDTVEAEHLTYGEAFNRARDLREEKKTSFTVVAQEVADRMRKPEGE